MNKTNKKSRLLQDFQLGNQLVQQFRFEEAREIYQKCVEKFPYEPQGYEGLAFLAHRTWERDIAAEWLDISIQKTKSKSSYRRKAKLLVNHAQFEEGFEVIDEVMEMYGKEEDTLLLKAELLLKPQRFSEAVDILLSINHNLAAQILLARALIGAKRYNEADGIIEKLLTGQKPFKEYEEKTLSLLACWQKYHRSGADFAKPKIFGIGLSRTATTSLTTALNLLGLTAIHFINPLTCQVIDIDDFLYYDAFCDSPVSFRFEELYSLFPNAKFIYTERNLADWVRSSANLYKPVGFSTTKELKVWLNKSGHKKFEKYYHNFSTIYQKAYDSLYADFPNWEAAYHAFDKRVQCFFKDKPTDKLLKIDVCAEPNWEKLCSFLNVPLPDVPFPHSNTIVAREKAKP